MEPYLVAHSPTLDCVIKQSKSQPATSGFTYKAPSKQPQLSEKKILCLRYASEGLDAKAIANKTRLTHGTVEQYLAAIRQSLGAFNIAHAIFIACKEGLI